MNNEVRTVKMSVIDPGEIKEGEFTFEMQPRYNPARTVRFSLNTEDAERLLKALEEYLVKA